jgi:probable phosphoglycerate mutase
VAVLYGFLGVATNNSRSTRASGPPRACRRSSSESLTIRSDSVLLSQQMKGAVQVKDPKLRSPARRGEAPPHRLPGGSSSRTCPRERNKDADALANKAMDLASGTGALAGRSAPGSGIIAAAKLPSL